MSDDKNPLEQAVDQAMDTFVYAPIGLLFDGPALFPKLVEKGRNQVQVARMMGQMAVQMGQSEAEKRVGRAGSQLRDSLAATGLVPTPAKATPEPASPTTSSRDGAAEATQPAKTQPAKATTAKKPVAKKTPAKKTTAKKTTAKKSASTSATAKKATATKAPSVGSLGIPDYDSLSASQVVSRLRGLAATDLDALRAYESATRARKTILNKITQLQKR